MTPLTLGSEVLQGLVGRLPLPTGRVPLVLAEYSADAYRSVEARWVQSSGDIAVTSAKQLMELIESWDTTPTSPARVVKAQEEARKAARQRVERMIQAAQVEEEADLRRQREAARRRLMRELGRTLRCLTAGDLKMLFREQLQRESRPDGRYHHALRLLNGFPTWTQAELDDIDQFVLSLSNLRCQARLLGSEVDAAIDDPRWRAAGSM